MPTTLTNGIQLPDKGSVDWYNSMQSNYNLIDTHLGNTDIHVTAEDKANWDSKQGSLSQAQLDAIAQVATNTDDIATLQSGKADASHTHSSSDITDIGDYATKDYVDNSISGLVDNAPAALDTLKELSTALNDDANFASTVTTALAAKADSADLATVATSGSYNDLSNKPTINDSTITIQKNGSTVDTFTTNGSAKTINIPVPTKTSDLTNDSNFVDTSNSAVASGITSAKVTSYDTHIADTDIHVTASDKTTWNAVTSKANDSDVVHKSGDETVNGVKTFSNNTYVTSLNFTNEVESQSSSNSAVFPIITTVTYGDSSPSQSARLNFRITANGVKSFFPHDNNVSLGLSTRVWLDFFAYHGYFRGQQQGDEYSSNARTNLTLLANRDTSGQSGCVVDTFRENTTQGTGSHILGIGMKENSVRYEGCRFSWLYDNNNNGYVFSLRPTTQGTNQPIKYELGNSLAKWSEIHGVTYYYGSSDTEFSDKFVTTDTTQTISSSKTFVGSQYFKDNNVQYFGIDFSKGTAPSAYTARCTYFSPLTGGGSTYQTSNGLIGCAVNNDNVVTTFMHAIKNTAGATTRTSFVLYYDTDNDKRSVATNGDFLPILSGQGIGNSTNKWVAINGLNPSALSMPDLSNGIDISSYINLTQASQYTAPANGYISICGSASTTNTILLKDHDYDFGITARAMLMGQNTFTTYLIIPVVKDHVYDIICNAVTTLDYAKFFPCQGNV